ncbi:MAG TPA: SMP-30/gluconolactonase/LRE family protein [Polyangiaceae bacterium]
MPMKAVLPSLFLGLLAAAACTDNGTPDDGGDTGGGTSGTGTGGSGGSAGTTGGANPTGGTNPTGGAGVTGGSAGAPTGGSSGASTGGTATGGSAGASTGGSAGAPTGGSAGASTGGSAGNGGSAGSGGAPGGSGGAGGGGSGSGGLYTCPSGITGMPLPANPMVTRVAGVPSMFGSSSSSNVEGPVWIDGALYVSHIQEGVQAPPPARILKVTGTTAEEFLLMAGTNGLAVNAMGNIVGARHTSGAIETLNLGTKTFTPVASQYMNARFNSPNDLAIRRDGNIYFSDPDFQAPSSRPQNQTRVYRVNPMGAVTVVEAGLSNPNGVTLSLDQNTLYVATSSNLYRYQVMADGSTGSSMMMNGVPGSDGMVMDCAGNLYLTDGNQHRVVVVTGTGTMVGTISMGIPNEANPTNVAFGGADHRRLYITTRGSGANGAGLYYIDLNIPGMPY